MVWALDQSILYMTNVSNMLKTDDTIYLLPEQTEIVTNIDSTTDLRRVSTIDARMSQQMVGRDVGFYSAIVWA